MAQSTQHKLDRVRPPRVQITYDVEIGGAITMKELPFVVGILSDLSGNPEEPLPKLKKRKFVEIDRDNFNEVLAASKPRLTFQADNKLVDDGSKFNVELKFSHMDDFNPVNVLKQVEPLSKLFEARGRLTDLIGKLDGNDDLDKLLQNIVANTESLKEIKAQTAGGEAEEEPKSGKAKAKKEEETPEEGPPA